MLLSLTGAIWHINNKRCVCHTQSDHAYTLQNNNTNIVDINLI